MSLRKLHGLLPDQPEVGCLNSHQQALVLNLSQGRTGRCAGNGLWAACLYNICDKKPSCLVSGENEAGMW